jgi:hypothetical protein
MKILLCNGRGGAGKSTLALALINYLSADPNNTVLAIDADTQLLNVQRSIANTKRGNITTLTADLHSEDGRDNFITNLEDYAKDCAYAVVSLPGYVAISKDEMLLIKAMLDELKCEVIEFFTITSDEDSVRLFELSQTSGFGLMSSQSVVVINMNRILERNEFVRWNNSQAKVKYQPREIYLPGLYWKYIDAYRATGLTLDEAAGQKDWPFVQRRAIESWVQAVNQEFQKIDSVLTGEAA